MKNRTTSALLALALVATAALAEDKPETPEHVTGDAPYPFDTVDPREEEKEPIELPGDVADKLELLTDEEVAHGPQLLGYGEDGDGHPGRDHGRSVQQQEHERQRYLQAFSPANKGISPPEVP